MYTKTEKSWTCLLLKVSENYFFSNMEKVLCAALYRSQDKKLNNLKENLSLALDTVRTQKVSYAFKGWQIR